MLIALIALALQSAPPMPDPPAPALQAALALFREHSVPEATRRFGIDNAIRLATSDALARSRSTYDPAKAERLRHRIAARVPIDQTKLDEKIGRCVVEETAWKLDADEIGAVRRFLLTPAGTKFWTVISYGAVVDCYRSSLVLHATDDDYRAAGLLPPRRPKPARERGTAVS